VTDYNSKIVALYDQVNPDGPDHDYYRSLAQRPETRRILDLGCGTGILTVTLATEGKEVFGVDPSPAMLNYARQRQDADKVTWVDGDSGTVRHGLFDLAVMTGNVAQHIPDPQWTQTLADLRKCLTDGGVLAFESRNPSRRAWEAWNEAQPEHTDTQFGPLTEWSQTEELGQGRVLLKSFTEFTTTGELVQEDVILHFRTEQEIREELQTAGFEVVSLWGDWHKTPFDGGQNVMIFESRAI